MSSRDRGHEVDALAEIISNQLQDSDWEDPEAAAAALRTLNERGWDHVIDSSIPSRDANIMKKASHNLGRIKEEFGLRTGSDTLAPEDYLEQQRRHVAQGVQELIDDYGVEAVLDAVETPERAPDEVREFVQDVLAEFPEEIIYDEVENDLRNTLSRIGRPHIPKDWAPEPEPIIPEEVERRIRRAEREREHEILSELEQAWGMRFDSVEEFIDKMNQYVATRGGERRERAEVYLRYYPSDDQWSIALDQPDTTQASARQWDDFRKEAQRRFENQIPFTTDQVDQPRTRVGTLTIRQVDEDDDGTPVFEIEGISWDQAREQFDTEGPPGAPYDVGGWTRQVNTVDQIVYRREGSLTGSGGAYTEIVIQQDNDTDGETWEILIIEYDADDTPLFDPHTYEQGLYDRGRAIDRAVDYMRNGEEGPDSQASQQTFDVEGGGGGEGDIGGTRALQDIQQAVVGGVERMLDRIPDETYDAATQAIQAGVAPDLVDQIRTSLEMIGEEQRRLLESELAREARDVDRDADRSLYQFLHAIPEYDPPEAVDPEAQRRREESEGEALWSPPFDEKADYDFIRDLRGGTASGESYRERIEGIIAALQTGEGEHSVHVPQPRLNNLSAETRRRLIGLFETELEQHMRENAGAEDFPSIKETVEQAIHGGNSQRLTKLRDILRGDRSNEGANTFDDEEFARLQQADAAREAFIDQLEQALHDRRTGQTDRQQRRRGSGLGGFEGDQPEPGMSEDEEWEYRTSASRHSAGTGPTEPYTDTCRLTGEEITRYPQFERLFQRLVRDIGWRRKFPDTNWELYWRLIPREQEREFERTPEGWLQRWVRGGVISRHDLYNRGFPEGAIPDAEDEEFARTPDTEHEYDRRTGDDLTEGERRMREHLGLDDDEDEGDADADDEDEGDEDTDRDRDRGRDTDRDDDWFWS